MAESKAKNDEKSFIESIQDYFSEVRAERKKVSWPTREEVINLTRIVLIVTTISAIFLGVLSVSLTLFLDQFGLDNPFVLALLFLAILLGVLWSFRQGERQSYR